MPYASESLRFNDNVSLGNFPVGIALNNWGAQGCHPTVAFGLGTNSTLLKTLKRSSKNLSNTWGLFWGRNGGTTSFQLGGSIVFGGYGGDLTIQLQSGLSVRVPNDQLVVPNVIIDRPTGALVVNGSAPDLVINSIQGVNANDLPQLGRQFLTAAYLMVNMDANQCTLWSANPTSDQNLVAVDTSDQEVTEYCGTGQSSPNNSGSDPSSTATGSSASSRTRLIAGAAAGSIGGVL
ncbi:aspartic-type endopeptidase [Apiospora aurea]|uniref:Aspartic-type endopeptidase n=1 Tax=Apiospora aurea TaxID=335848 RepID=A0ABR1QB80_9PEZI